MSQTIGQHQATNDFSLEMQILTFFTHLEKHENIPDVVELYRYGRFLLFGFYFEDEPGIMNQIYKNEV
jgi:hypothetical protein